MNRKIKLKYFYKIAASKPMSMRQKILAGMVGLGTAIGVTQMPEQESVPAVIETPIVQEVEQPKELSNTSYKIKSGDNIMDISLKLFPGQADRAKKYILEINNLTEDSAKNLRAGQILKIPGSKEEFVDHFDLEENHHLKASSSVKDFIKQVEKLHPIGIDIEENDEKNIETVGYGRRLNTKSKRDDYEKELRLLKQIGRKDEKFTESDPVVTRWFNEDIKEAEDRVKAKALPALTQNQFDALVSFSFNTGGVPDIKEDLKSGNIAAAADKIRNHASASIEGYAGLATRRAEEADLFMSN